MYSTGNDFQDDILAMIRTGLELGFGVCHELLEHDALDGAVLVRLDLDEGIESTQLLQLSLHRRGRAGRAILKMD